MAPHSDDIATRALAEINRRASASRYEAEATPEHHASCHLPGTAEVDAAMTWFVVLTNPQAGSEERASWGLRRRGVASYYPRLVRDVPKRGGGREVRVSPLFVRYLFVGLDPHAGMGLGALQGVSGLEGLVRLGGEPATVPAAVLGQLRGLEAQGAFDMRRAAVEMRFREGQKVEITSGPFAGLVGQVARAKPGKRVEVLLSMLGGLISAQIEAGDLREAE